MRTPAAPGREPELVPLENDSWLSQPDRDRNLGLAYLEAMSKPNFEDFAEAYEARARHHLDIAYASGLRDAETLQGLADCSMDRDRLRAMDLARQAIAAPDRTPDIHARALTALASGEIRGRNATAAVAPLEELVGLRRQGNDWRLLGWC